MLVLEKLEKMSDFIGKSRIDGELAQYFLENLDRISSINLQRCIKDTGISKATIHRFYSKAGFESFADLTTTLSKELNELEYLHSNTKNYHQQVIEYCNKCQFHQTQIKNFIYTITKANQVLLYGTQRATEHLFHTLYFLKKQHIRVSSLSSWDISNTMEKIEQLKENDVLIIIGTSLNVQNMYEQSMNKKYMLNLYKINSLCFHKFYIGESNCDQWNGFYNIKIPSNNDDLMLIGLDLLDNVLYSKLKEGNI